MSLSAEQKQTVSTWVTAGDNLSAIQKKLREQFQVSLTYMEVRFLIDDLNLALKDQAPKPSADLNAAPSRAQAPAAATAPAADDDLPPQADELDEALPHEDDALPAEDAEAPAGASSLSVSGAATTTAALASPRSANRATAPPRPTIKLSWPN
jgi:hypothetical protein